jgi:ankyrin repeat protein
LAAYLEISVRSASKSVGASVSSAGYIGGLADKLLSTEVRTDVAEVKTRYSKAITGYLTHGHPRAMMRQILPSLRKGISAPPPEPLMLLSLAAVVGDMEAVKCYAADTALWPGAVYLDVPGRGKPKGLFWCSIKTASSAGHMDVVKHLLGILDPLIPIYQVSQREDRRWTSIKSRIHRAIMSAIQSKRVEVLDKLLGFAIRHGFDINNCSRCEVKSKDCGHSWIKLAAKSGAVDISQAILETLSEELDDFATRYHDLLFQQACEYGQIEFIRYLLEDNWVSVEEVAPEGFARAAACLHRNVIEVLLEYSADVNQNSPIFSAIEHGNLSIMKLMLLHGAKVFPRVISQCESFLNAKKYTRLRDFDRQDPRPVTIYIAAKLGGLRPAMLNREPLLCGLVEDVEDSKFWSAKVADAGMLAHG